MLMLCSDHIVMLCSDYIVMLCSFVSELHTCIYGPATMILCMVAVLIVAQTRPQKSSPSELLWWLSVNK